MNFLINLAFCIVTYETKVYIPCLVEIAALNKYALDIFSIIQNPFIIWGKPKRMILRVIAPIRNRCKYEPKTIIAFYTKYTFLINALKKN